MPPRRRTDPAAGEQALAAWLATQTGGREGAGAVAGTAADVGTGTATDVGTSADPGAQVPRATLATAVRYTLEELAAVAPGRSVEVRVPPFAAVQCVEGPRHTRGTPTNVIETDAQTWLALATGRLGWADAEASGVLRASGQRADLTAYLPVLPVLPDGSN